MNKPASHHVPHRYQDVYPSLPLLDSTTAARSAADLLTLEYFEAEPGEMPAEVFAQHHVLLDLRDSPLRVEATASSGRARSWPTSRCG